MKSLVRRSLYTALGVIGNGTAALESMGRKLARQAELSEKDGEVLARRLRTHSEKAVNNLSAEVKKAAASLHAKIKEEADAMPRVRVVKVRRHAGHTVHAGKAGHAHSNGVHHRRRGRVHRTKVSVAAKVSH